MTELILVGTDGSETATMAVSEAADLAANLGAKLLILTAFPNVTDTRLGEQARNTPKQWRSTQQAEADETLAQAVASLGQTDAPVETLAQEDDLTEAIISVAENAKPTSSWWATRA